MTARAHSRGWPIEYDGTQWIFSDTRSPVDSRRSCRRCGRQPTAEGHDYCLGYVGGASSACCGHGVEPGFVVAGGYQPASKQNDWSEIKYLTTADVIDESCKGSK